MLTELEKLLAVADAHVARDVQILSMNTKNAPKATASTGNRHQISVDCRRGPTCELCGVRAKPKPITGKARYKHKCPHGLWCVRGEPGIGLHQNHPTCPDCSWRLRMYSQSDAEADPNGSAGSGGADGG